jgi:hypothetical protein
MDDTDKEFDKLFGRDKGNRDPNSREVIEQAS